MQNKTTNDMTEPKEILDAAQVKMDKIVAHLIDDLASVRAGRASTNLPDARTVLVQPWEKNMIAPIEKAILVANIGLTPSNNGEHIRLNIPPLTEERRKELVKQIRADAETARVGMRAVRRDAVESFKKAQKDGMPEDMAKDGEESVQKLTDKYSKKVDELLAGKEKEIMTV